MTGASGVPGAGPAARDGLPTEDERLNHAALTELDHRSAGWPQARSAESRGRLRFAPRDAQELELVEDVDGNRARPCAMSYRAAAGT